MDYEFYLLNLIQQHVRNDFFDVLMPLVSMLGKAAALWVIIAAVLLCFKKTRTVGRSMAWNLASGGALLMLTVKPIVNRIRPYVLNDTVSLLVSPETNASFPSGHTFMAFGASTVIFLYNKKLGIISYMLSAVIAFSRLYLYVHFPSDVLCGAILGIVSALVFYRIETILFPPAHHRFQPVTES